MEPSHAARAYKEDAVESAPPIKLVRMLLQAALRFIDRASGEDPKLPSSDFVECVTRADAIVAELRVSLDDSFDPELCGRLEQLYLFVEQRFLEALTEREAAPLADARSVLASLLETWSKVELDAAPDLEGNLDAA